MRRIASLILFALIGCSPFMGLAQSTQAVPAITHRWTLYGGIGPNFYFNNLEIVDNEVRIDFRRVTRWHYMNLYHRVDWRQWWFFGR